MSQWVRLWEDMPDDPKWRVIAKRSGRPVHQVIAVFTRMLVNASRSSVRGTLEHWDDEDEAVALDMETIEVASIRNAMQGKVLDGNSLTGWEKRQPKREEPSSDRVRAFRERQAELKRNETHGNARNAPEEKREEKIANDPPSLPTTPMAEKERGGGNFDEFWGKYPKSPASSPSKARAAFNELSQDDQRKAIDYLPAFKSVKTTNPMSPERYIRDRIFDNLTPRVVSTSEKVKHNSPEGKAWDAYERQIKGKPPPWTNGVWYFPTKTPPATSDIVCMRS